MKLNLSSFKINRRRGAIVVKGGGKIYNLRVVSSNPGAGYKMDVSEALNKRNKGFQMRHTKNIKKTKLNH